MKGRLDHKKSFHAGIRYQCEQCGAKFDGCDLCEYQATTMGALKKHMVIVHSGVKLQCDQYKVHKKNIFFYLRKKLHYFTLKMNV